MINPDDDFAYLVGGPEHGRKIRVSPDIQEARFMTFAAPVAMGLAAVGDPLYHDAAKDMVRYVRKDVVLGFLAHAVFVPDDWARLSPDALIARILGELFDRAARAYEVTWNCNSCYHEIRGF